MSKLTKTQKDQLKKVGITGVDSEDQARKKLIKYLDGEGVDNVDDEKLIDLISMAEAFYTVSEDDSDEKELDDLVEELEEELEELEEEDEELEELEEEPAKPAKPSKSSKPAKPEKDKGKSEVGKLKKGTIIVFNAKDEKSHKKFIQPFIEEFFPEDEFEIKILKSGFTVRFSGDSSSPTVMNFDSLKIVDGEYLLGDLYCNRLKTPEELEEFLTDEYYDDESELKHQVGMFRGETHPSIKKVTTDQVLSLLRGDGKNDGIFKYSYKKAAETDKRIAKKVKEMEESLKNNKKK